MHVSGTLSALARPESRKMSVGNSRAASFTFCQIWPEIMSFLTTKRAYFYLSTDLCCQKQSEVSEVTSGSALAKLCVVVMLQHDEYVGNLQRDKIPLSLAD